MVAANCDDDVTKSLKSEEYRERYRAAESMPEDNGKSVGCPGGIVIALWDVAVRGIRSQLAHRRRIVQVVTGELRSLRQAEARPTKIGRPLGCET